MTACDFKPGQKVALVSWSGQVIGSGVVAAVKRHKVRTKVTLASGGEYDERGRSWVRGRWPTGSGIRPWTDDDDKEVAHRRLAHDVETLARSLREDDLMKVAPELLREVRRALRAIVPPPRGKGE